MALQASLRALACASHVVALCKRCCCLQHSARTLGRKSTVQIYVLFGVASLPQEVPAYPEDTAPGAKAASADEVPSGPAAVPGSPWEGVQSWPCTASHVRVLLEAPALKVAEDACCSTGGGNRLSGLLALQAAERALGQAAEGGSVATHALVVTGVPELPWLIPVGCAAHAALVNMGTAAAALLGAACVVYYSATQSFVAR